MWCYRSPCCTPWSAGPRSWRASCRHLADIGTRPNVSVRVLPFKAGLPVGTPVGPYVILDFAAVRSGDQEPTVIYIENYTGDMYLEGETDIQQYRDAWTIFQRAALDAVTSRSLLRQVARKDDQG
ncbi:DUF5753 domain-containing protein [Nocardia sp. NBC_01503]|uniref:Scr1 family TA system antitoxin-like transcriptional regulator n=1 Tax=Nocardia sp. NBC_01503 TaxID=2975997 RepID=UPI002E7B4F16|nr:Scr1 family TA system antitoxin-like transcriptional regulator [Nocardia sp. NBC_01503]WTL35981.1 DUF5753 domain-containing protein [Nocardia sp. NBC_01503]